MPYGVATWLANWITARQGRYVGMQLLLTNTACKSAHIFSPQLYICIGNLPVLHILRSKSPGCRDWFELCPSASNQSLGTGTQQSVAI